MTSLKFIALAIVSIFWIGASAGEFERNLRELFSSHGVYPLTTYKSPYPAQVKLGEKLFSDPILSGNKNISCQTCHHPDHGTSDRLPLSIGEGGQGLGPARALEHGKIIPRNSPALWNLASAKSLFWDGRVSRDKLTGELATPEPKLNGAKPELAQYAALLDSALAAQAMFPPTSAEEMAGQFGSNEIADAEDNVEKWRALTARVTSQADYAAMLAQAYPGVELKDFNFAHLARAIAEFEKENFQATRTPLDLFLAGDDTSMDDKQKAGALFFLTKGKCIECHHGQLLSDFKTHAIGFPQIGPGKTSTGDDLGRMHATGHFGDRYAFRTPPLRNVILSGPWGHNGAFRDMRDLILHYFHPPRSYHSYNFDNSGLPYQLTEEQTNKKKRFANIDALIAPGFMMNQEDFGGLHDFLVFALTEKK